MSLTLTIVSSDDTEFIEKVYFSTRNDEFSSLGWSTEQLELFLRMQLNFQQQSYKLQFPDSENFIINSENERVGRLILFRNEREIRVVDIAVLPEFRGKGIATTIIGELIKKAVKEQKKLALQVLKNNLNAFNLYKKLGFAVNGEDELYFSMEQ